jgi:hypothetical protein
MYCIAYLRRECQNSKFVIFKEKLLKFLKCYNLLWVQRRHNCSPAASFANCVMTLYLLKVHLQTFLSIPISQKCQILSCNTLVTNERYIHSNTILWLKNTICLFTSGRSKSCSFLQTRPDGLWGPPNPICNEHRSFLPREIAAKDCSLPLTFIQSRG